MQISAPSQGGAGGGYGRWIRHRNCEWQYGARLIGRAAAGAGLVALIAVGGCTRRETLAIVPATMSTGGSLQNHPQDGGQVLSETASLSARVQFRSVHRWGLRITARATPAADGVWPQMRVELDGMPAHTIVVADRDLVPYWLNFVAEPGMADLKVSLLNGRPAGAGPALVIERVELVPL